MATMDVIPFKLFVSPRNFMRDTVNQCPPEKRLKFLRILRLRSCMILIGVLRNLKRGIGGMETNKSVSPFCLGKNILKNFFGEIEVYFLSEEETILFIRQNCTRSTYETIIAQQKSSNSVTMPKREASIVDQCCNDRLCQEQTRRGWANQIIWKSTLILIQWWSIHLKNKKVFSIAKH